MRRVLSQCSCRYGWLFAVIGVVAAAKPAVTQTERPPRLRLQIGAGYTAPLTELGVFGSARAKLGGAPVVTGTIGLYPDGRALGVGLGVIGAVTRSIRIEPASGCRGSCVPFDVSEGRLAGIGLDALVRVGMGATAIQLSAGPWIRTYRSGKTFSVCDLDEYCANATYFYPTDTRLAARLGIAVLVAGGMLPLMLQATDLISSYRTGRTQHNVAVALIVGAGGA